jgi:hypothetical protein
MPCDLQRRASKLHRTIHTVFVWQKLQLLLPAMEAPSAAQKHRTAWCAASTALNNTIKLYNTRATTHNFLLI